MKFFVLAVAALMSMTACSAENGIANDNRISSDSQELHSWYNYRWQKPIGSELQLAVVNNLSAAWTPFLTVSKTDWSTSSVLNMNVTKGRKGANMNCASVQGTIQVCNYPYGTTGWSGLTSVGIVGGYVVQATVKMNDSYTLTNDWKQYVMCHELGHSVGLAHVDTDTTNPDTGSCLDMTSNPAVNKQPNAHDFEHLEIIYADAPATRISAFVGTNNANEWGTLRSKTKYEENYVKQVGDNAYVHTHIVLVQ